MMTPTATKAETRPAKRLFYRGVARKLRAEGNCYENAHACCLEYGSLLDLRHNEVLFMTKVKKSQLRPQHWLMGLALILLIGNLAWSSVIYTSEQANAD